MATSLYQAFTEAKHMCMQRLYQPWVGGGTPSMFVFGKRDLEEQLKVFGEDPYAYGIKANAKAIDMVQTFSVEQGLTKSKQPWNELFPEEVLLAEDAVSG